MSDLYSDLILDHYRFPHNKGRIENASCSCKVNNPLCGDHLEMSALVKNDLIEEVKFEGKGCAISQAAASMLTDYAKGKHPKDILSLEPAFVLEMLGVKLGPNRVKCALLSLEALKKTLLLLY